MADNKITSLTADASPALDDLVVTVSDPGGAPANRKVTLSAVKDLLFAGRILSTKGSDVASANDITLGDGNYFDITGSTQINTIATTGWTAGSVVALQFDGVVTVAHNTAGTGAPILLVGGLDFLATADDTLTLAFDGSSWREVSRSVILVL